MKRLPIWLGCAGLVAALALVGCGDDDKKDPGVAQGGSGGDGGAGGSGGTGGTGGTGGSGGGEFDLVIPGLEAPVDVSFDEKGVLHASCQTDADCMQVLGYFHAANRFWQMDLQRRAARGRLATLITVASTDEFMRRYLSTPQGVPLEDLIWDQMDQDLRTIIEAYSDGVNAWLEDLRAGRNGAKLTEEYASPIVTATPASIPDWEPKDSVAFARLMTYLLSDSMEKEQALGEAFPRLDPALAVDFFTMRPGVERYTQETGAAIRTRPAVDLAAVQALQDRLRPVEGLLAAARASRPELAFFAPAGEQAGSNNWVIAPQHTEAGKAILANDPHLALSNAPIWYFAELDSKTNGEGTLHVAGATFPGAPGFPIGRNENVSWGATVANYDVTDVYVETLNAAGDAVMFDGAEVKIVSKVVQIGGKDVTLEWVPHHGPVVAKDVAGGKAISVRWTGHEPSDELAAFLGLARATSVAEGKEALKKFEVGAQNFVLVDTEGHIGWYPHARVPNRPWASYSLSAPAGTLPPWMPLPGDGSAEWDGYLPESELPQLFDPAKGWIATANQDMNGASADGDPTNDDAYLQGLVAPGFRLARIAERLEATLGSITPESTKELQGDTYSLLAAMIMPTLLDSADDGLPANAKKIVAALEAWDFTCPTGLTGADPKSAYSDDEAETRESIGCTAFHFVLPRILEVAYGDKLAATNLTLGTADSNSLVRPLVIALQRPDDRESGDALWNLLDGTVRTPREVLRESLVKAGAEIQSTWGADPNDWRWGRKHTVTFKTELSAIAPKLDLGPFATQGGQFTVNVANPGVGGKTFTHTSGASLRMVSEASDGGITTWLQLPGGQDLHRDGDHYGDLVEDWLENRSFRLPFTRDEVEEAAVTKIVAGP